MLTVVSYLPRPKFEEGPPTYANRFYASVNRMALRVGSVRERFAAVYSQSGSNIDPGVKFSDLKSLLLYLPRAFEIGCFAPFLTTWVAPGKQVGSAGRLLAGAETLIMYLFELLALVAVLRPPRRLAAWLLLCISAVGVTLLALVVPNVGALYRFRYTFWVLLIVLGTKGFEALLKSSGRMRPSLGGVLSLFDGSSIKRVAAMACGCPLVVSDIAAHREILDDRTACFVSPDEPGQVADAIKTTLQSRAEAQTRAQAGRAKAGHWGIEDMGLLYEKLYLNLLATRDTPTSHDYLYYSP